MLVTSAGRKVPLIRAMVVALKRINPMGKVIAGDSDPLSPAQFFAEDFWAMPVLNEMGAAELFKQLKSRRVTTVFPTRDGELSFWAALKTDLAAEGIHVVVSPTNALNRCLDKLEFAQWAQERDLPVIPASLDASAYGNRPLVVKERFGSGAKGVALNLTVRAAQSHAQHLTSPIFQPYIAGEEISIDAFLDQNSMLHGLSIRSRDNVINGESAVTTTFRNEKIEAEAGGFLTELELQGPVVMQAILTDDGMEVIEVNPRFGGASTASIAVGLDLLYWALAENKTREGGLPRFERAEKNVRQIRVPHDKVLYGSDF